MGTVQQAENGGEYAIPGVVFTLNAPLSPRGGDRFAVVDASFSFATNNCTIVRGAALLEGIAVQPDPLRQAATTAAGGTGPTRPTGSARLTGRPRTIRSSFLIH